MATGGEVDADRASGAGARAKIGWRDIVRTGPGTLAGRYLRSFWQPVYRSVDLQPGQALPLTVMSEDYTLFRGADGRAHVLAPRCAHRGTLLSTGWVEGDCVRCFYHGWTYDGSGQCVEAPAERPGFAETVRIASYPVQEYLGLIFAYLGTGAPPPLPHYPEFEGDDSLLRVQGPQVWPCNYFNRIENSLDHVHGAFVHRRRVAGYGLFEIPEVSGRETSYGIEMVGKRKGHRRLVHFHMPNVNYRTPWAARNGVGESEVDPEGGTAAQIAWRVPVTDESCTSFVVSRLRQPYADPGNARQQERNGRVRSAAEAILRGEGSVEDFAEPGLTTNVEDFVAQVGQGVIADRDHERLGRSDVLVILLRRLWERELRALAEGQPLTSWHRPKEPLEISSITDADEADEQLTPQR